MGTRVAVPIEAFPGVMGVALDEPGGHSTMPPRRSGGNMDIRQLTGGATLYLPVLVPRRAVQRGRRPRRPGRRRGLHHRGGDERPGARCGSVSAAARRCPSRSCARPGRRPARGDAGPWYATTANGPDLFASSQQAIRYMIDHIVRERGLSREEAYIVCSVAVDLKISEIVDAPNWIVSAFLPESIFL